MLELEESINLTDKVTPRCQFRCKLSGYRRGTGPYPTEANISCDNPLPELPGSLQGDPSHGKPKALTVQMQFTKQWSVSHSRCGQVTTP